MATKLHLGLLNFLPVLGFAIYASLTGFDDPFFMPLLLVGWIVVVVYQTILTAVYTPPHYPWLAIAGIVLTPLVLLFYSNWKGLDINGIFIEMAAIDLVGIILAFAIAVVYKLSKEGFSDAPIGPLVIVFGLFGTACFYLIKFILKFLEIQNNDWVIGLLLLVGVVRSALFFSSRMNKLTDRMGAKGSDKTNSAGSPKDINPALILISIGIWIIVVPLLTYLVSLFTAHQ